MAGSKRRPNRRKRKPRVVRGDRRSFGRPRHANSSSSHPACSCSRSRHSRPHCRSKRGCRPTRVPWCPVPSECVPERIRSRTGTGRGEKICARSYSPLCRYSRRHRTSRNCWGHDAYAVSHSHNQYIMCKTASTPFRGGSRLKGSKIKAQHPLREATARKDENETTGELLNTDAPYSTARPKKTREPTDERAYDQT